MALDLRVCDAATRNRASVYIRLSTCCNATTESAGKLCCASSASRKVSGATERCWGGGIAGCWLLGYMLGCDGDALQNAAGRN